MLRQRLFLTFCLVLPLMFQLQAQDQNYSQFFNNDLYYNPATTGLYLGMRANVNYRNQWTNLPYDFKSYNVTLDFAGRSLPGQGGLGLIVHSNNEGEGLLNYTIAALSLSSRVNINQNIALQFGMSAGIAQRRINWDNLVFTDQLNGVTGVGDIPSNFTQPENSKVVYPDFNVGLVLNYVGNTTNARIGAAFHHIFTPKIGFIESESELPMRFVAHGDLLIEISENSRYRSGGDAKINPGIMYENQQGANTFSLGLNGFKSFIYLGLWYRNEDINVENINSMVFLLGVNLPFNEESRIKLIYSYDYVMNSTYSTGGTHEISLIFGFDNVSLFGYKPGSKGRSNRHPLECSPF